MSDQWFRWKFGSTDEKVKGKFVAIYGQRCMPVVVEILATY